MPIAMKMKLPSCAEVIDARTFLPAAGSMRASLFACLLGLCAVRGQAAPPAGLSRQTATVASLFTPDEAKSLSKTIAPDMPVTFKVWRAQEQDSGVLVFVNASDSGDPPSGWLDVLERKHLSWIGAERFGNRKPSAQRVLAAVMALKVMVGAGGVDTRRTYVGGISGGGRVASQASTHFPQLFSGALYVVGADFFLPPDVRLRALLSSNRFVFVTGSRDFNLNEMKQVHEKYLAAGIAHSMLMDIPDFGHELPSAEQLAAALDFLDAR